MRIRITSEVIGDITLKDKISCQFYIYTFELYKDENAFFLSVEKRVSEYFEYLPKIDNHNCISIPETSFYSDMVESIKNIEAFGSFNIGIKKILYEEAVVTWIPETIEEEKMLSIKSHKVTKAKQSTHFLNKDDFQDTLFYCKRLSDEHVPFTYYRLGKSFFDDDEYYLSFINYYMMIEYLYSRGNTTKTQEKKDFGKSDVLRLSILMVINLLPKNNLNYKWLQEECKRIQKDCNVETIIHILVEYRGRIAHGLKNNKSGEYRSNQQLLRPITYLLGMICYNVCGCLKMFSNIPNEQKDLYLKERIRELGSTI